MRKRRNGSGHGIFRNACIRRTGEDGEPLQDQRRRSRQTLELIAAMRRPLEKLVPFVEAMAATEAVHRLLRRQGRYHRCRRRRIVPADRIERHLAAKKWIVREFVLKKIPR